MYRCFDHCSFYLRSSGGSKSIPDQFVCEKQLLIFNLQKKTREHLIQLLPLCGHKGALKASLSVIFSSSSDLAVDSRQAASSGEASGDEQGDIDDAGFSGRQVSALCIFRCQIAYVGWLFKGKGFLI